MQLFRRRFLRLTGGAAMPGAFPRAIHAEAFPSRPITMVVPVPAGGAMDTIARIVAGGMQAALGQPIVIENVTGASGSIGAGRVARAMPDGYMIVYGALVTHVVNAAVYQLPYDVVTDFEPIAMIAATPWLICAKKGLPANDLRGLVALGAFKAKLAMPPCFPGKKIAIALARMRNSPIAALEDVRPNRDSGYSITNMRSVPPRPTIDRPQGD
jgi:tripartite-type tricarboxylate transporter receptor subunit TctC